MGKVLKQMKNRNVKNITKKPKPKQMKRGGRAK